MSEIRPADSLSKDNPIFPILFAQAAGAVACLIDLSRIRYYYPNVIKKEEEERTRNILQKTLESALKTDAPLLSIFLESKSAYEKGWVEAEDKLRNLLLLVYMRHPLWSNILLDHKKAESIYSRINEEIDSNVLDDLGSIVHQFAVYKINDCCYPTPVGDSSFVEPGRYLQTSKTYWKLTKNMLSYCINDSFSLTPSQLFPLFINLQLRLEECFNGILMSNNTINTGDTFEKINESINILLNWDIDLIGVSEQHVTNLMKDVDTCIEQLRFQIGSKLYPLTDEENYFIGFSEASFAQFIERAQEEKEKLIKHAEKFENTNSEEEYVFRLEKKYWRVKFQGESYTIKNYVGMRYMVYLIQRAYNDEPEISAFDLYLDVRGRPVVDNSEYSKMTIKQLSELGLDVSRLGKGFDLLTIEGKKWIGEQIKELDNEIEVAKNLGEKQKALHKRKKKESVEEYYLKSIGLGGRKRKSADLSERVRKSVEGSIRSCLKNLGLKESDELAVYLHMHIKKGVFCEFLKDPQIDWKIIM